jgi:hypothetical protein
LLYLYIRACDTLRGNCKITRVPLVVATSLENVMAAPVPALLVIEDVDRKTDANQGGLAFHSELL